MVSARTRTLNTEAYPPISFRGNPQKLTFARTARLMRQAVRAKVRQSSKSGQPITESPGSSHQPRLAGDPPATRGNSPTGSQVASLAESGGYVAPDAGLVGGAELGADTGGPFLVGVA